MDSPSRRRFAIQAIPLIITVVAASRAAPRVRAVDFVLVFASGVLFGVTVMGLIQTWKARGA